MDIKQQTKNVAAQGRFGDSMLLHVNPAEVKGLASSMPITTNPETGQPEAFLPFLAPMLGSLLGPSILGGLGGLGLSSAALSGIGAGLATYAQTGGSGKKALLSGLTAGLGAKALEGAAQGLNPKVIEPIATGGVLPTDTAASNIVSQVAAVNPNIPTPVVTPPIDKFSSLRDTGAQLFSGGLDEGLKNIAGAAMTPTGMLAATAAGTGAVMQSQEDFEAMLRQMDIDEEERKRLMYERYPEQIPIASGGKIGFQRGRNVNISYDPIMNMNYDGYNTNASRAPIARRANPIPFGFMPGFMPEFSYFQNLNPTATSIQGGFQQPIQPLAPPGGFRNEGRFMPPQRFGGFGNPFMQTPSYQSFYGNPQMGAMFNPYARFNQQPIQPYFPQPPVNTPPPPPVDIPPPSDGGDPPSDGPIIPPFDDGIGRKGRIRNIEPISPPDDFITPGPINRPQPMPIMKPHSVRGPIRPINKPMPFNPPIDMSPRQTIEDNPPFIKDTPPPTVTIPIEGGADVTIPDFTKINTPNPRDNFMSIGGPGGGYTSDEVIGAGGRPELRRGVTSFDRLIDPTSGTYGDRTQPLQDMRARYEGPPLQAKPFIPPTPAAPTPFATINQPVLQKMPLPPKRDDFMSIGGPGGGFDLDERDAIDSGVPTQTSLGERVVQPDGTITQALSASAPDYIPPSRDDFFTASGTAREPVNVPINAPMPTAPGNTPTMQQFKPPMSGGIFGAPMFAEGKDTSKDTSKELPNEGLKALYASGEKGREAVEAMGYQEGQDINIPMPTGQSTDMMMQDPIVQEVIQFILGETDNRDVVNEFIVKYGQEQFMMLRNMILAQAAGNPNVQTEGLIEGNGNSGMADDLPMNIGNKAIAAVSQDEYIIPADVVSMLGDGSSDAGSKQLDSMLDRIRTEKTGTTKQAKPLNTSKVLPV